jgi:polyhydroxybutyrate depolymerase
MPPSAPDGSAQPDATATDGSVTPCSALSRGPGDYDETLSSGGRTRTYHVHVPPSYRSTTATPVVLGFHGGGGSAAQFAHQTSLSATADSDGFILVTPDGTGAIPGLFTWNAGNCCGYAVRNQVDDVELVRALLDQLGTEFCVDPQ